MIRRGPRALPFVALLACGGVTRSHHAPEMHPPSSDAGATTIVDAAVDAGPPKIELVAARHERVAPGMREITRSDLDLARDHELALPAFEADTCVRAAFDADAPTAVTLVGASGITLSSVDAANGAIGAAGPVCFKKGDVATFRFNGQSRLRIVVWASP